MPVLTFSIICIIIYYWETPQKAVRVSSPILGLLIIIKNSSLFFVLIILMLQLCQIYQSKRNILNRFFAYSIIIPFSILYLWKCHIKMVFLNAEGTRHSISIMSMVEIFNGKSHEELSVILINYLKKWFSFTSAGGNNSGEWTTLIVFSLIILCAFFFHMHSRKTVFLIFLGTISGYITYKICLLGMYLFNMPDEDALYIGAYDRYTRSITILIYGISILIAIHLLNVCYCKISCTRHAICYTLIILSVIIQTVFSPVPLKQFVRPNYAEGGLYRQLTKIKNDYNLPEKDGRILLYTNTQYAGFFLQYCFRSPNAICVTTDMLREILNDNMKSYDYLIITDHDEMINEILTEYSFPMNTCVISF